MNLKTIFKRLILLDLLIFFLAVIAILFESEIVVSFNESMNPPNEMDGILIFISLFFLVAYLVNLYLLYRFINFGKQMYLFMFVFISVFSLLMGISAYDPIYYVIDGLGWANSGAILVFLYFTPIKKEFDK